ncbi:hypothetical protein LIER_09823 [Lithospermum erythrorhizon]|uniref:Uncharacterized protein n=1 Tax=Lithospermum erythrorhizon TaxID=34254 RepID=A0AAV3PLD7_LITER
MGNCIGTFCIPSIKNNVTILTFDGRKELVQAATEAAYIINSAPYNQQGFKLVHPSKPKEPLSPDTRLRSGEVYYLIPKEVDRVIAKGNGHRGRQVKIVMSRQQLEMLVKNAQGRQKWKPSVVTIPELENY